MSLLCDFSMMSMQTDATFLDRNFESFVKQAVLCDTDTVCAKI